MKESNNDPWEDFLRNSDVFNDNKKEQDENPGAEFAKVEGDRSIMKLMNRILRLNPKEFNTAFPETSKIVVTEMGEDMYSVKSIASCLMTKAVELGVPMYPAVVQNLTIYATLAYIQMIGDDDALDEAEEDIN